MYGFESTLRVWSILLATLVCLGLTNFLRAQETKPESEPVLTLAPDAKPVADAPPTMPAPEDIWKKVPVLQKMPPLGNTFIFPTDPGYYSILDMLQDNYRKARPKYPYPTFGLRPDAFYNADWKYLDDPKNEDHDWLDFLKRIRIHDNWMFTTGGEFRWRFMNEVNANLSNKNDNYNLFREDLYADINYRDIFRFYLEFLDAESVHQNLPPTPFNYTQAELLNLFVEFKLGEIQGNPLQLRAGKQELLYGSQRLISPLDWANVRRTFSGVKMFTQGEKWNFDMWWVQPVAPTQVSADSVDDGQNFSGLWFTYKPKKGTLLDFYALNLDNANRVARGENGRLGTLNITTLGNRLYGREDQWLYDIETMFQIGHYSDQTLVAGASTISVGYSFDNLPTTPQFWLANDFATGTPYPQKGNQFSTFQPLFPFGHYYLGYIDIVNRQNINDLNFQLISFPANWFLAGLQFHHFNLVCSRDALYADNGKPLRRDPTGNAGTDVGNELDLFFNFTLTRHQNILIGYSKLFQGTFLDKTGSLQSPETTYVQYGYRW